MFLLNVDLTFEVHTNYLLHYFQPALCCYCTNVYDNRKPFVFIFQIWNTIMQCITYSNVLTDSSVFDTDILLLLRKFVLLYDLLTKLRVLGKKELKVQCQVVSYQGLTLTSYEVFCQTIKYLINTIFLITPLTEFRLVTALQRFSVTILEMLHELV